MILVVVVVVVVATRDCDGDCEDGGEAEPMKLHREAFRSWSS